MNAYPHRDFFILNNKFFYDDLKNKKKRKHLWQNKR